MLTECTRFIAVPLRKRSRGNRTLFISGAERHGGRDRGLFEGTAREHRLLFCVLAILGAWRFEAQMSSGQNNPILGGFIPMK